MQEHILLGAWGAVAVCRAEEVRSLRGVLFFSALVQDTPAISLDGVLAVNATAWNVFHLSIATACHKVGDKNA